VTSANRREKARKGGVMRRQGYSQATGGQASEDQTRRGPCVTMRDQAAAPVARMAS